VQAALHPREALIEYFSAPDRLVVFVLTRDDLRSVEVAAARDELAGQVRVARDLLGRAEGSSEREARAVLGALYQKLIDPARQTGLLREARRLIVVPHAALGYLPAAALLDSARGRFLMQDYALLYLPSAAALVALRTDADGRQPVGRRSYGFAPFPEALTASTAELRALRGTFHRVRLRRGSNATELRLRQALTQGEVVHVASHGVMNPRNPMFSRLTLARGGGQPEDDGRLEVHELIGLRASASLVFLSGCETGVGAAWATGFARGEDYATLAQAFLYAGARNVLATLWPIEDRGASAFADRFYTRLKMLPPPEALAAAQQDLLAGAEFGQPFHWAAYVLSGDGAFPMAGAR
jgi:CHAT domain-containing protein